MEEIRTDLQAAIAAAFPVLTDVSDAAALSTTGEADLLSIVAGAEKLGRVADAIRVILAGEVAHRSRRALGAEGLAKRMGCDTPAELLERSARISSTTAGGRLRLGKTTRPDLSIAGEVLPATFPAVREGLVLGRLGLDSGRIITSELTKISDRVPGAKIAVAEHELVAAAIGTAPAPDVAALPPVTPTETRIHAAAWVEVLDPDGGEPSEHTFNDRSFWLGRPKDGLIPVNGKLLPEVAGLLQRNLDALTNMRQSLRFLTPEQLAELDVTGDDDAGRDAADRDAARRDPRTRSQRQHDALATVFDVVGRCEQLPTLGGASPTMIITTRADDFDAGTGVGHVDGIDEPIPMSAVRQQACTNGIQPIELKANGRVLKLGDAHRFFNRHQRRALAARDGGCIIPGCPIPAWACEAHHVIAAEHDGPTHVDNGVLLCWFHHRTIETSGWKIRMLDGSPQVKPPIWLGDPVWRPATKSPTRIAQHLVRRMRQ